MGGSAVHHTEQVDLNQSGRNLTEQMNLRIASRISRQKDKGYKETIEAAMQSSNLNQLGLLRPMLAQQREKARHTNFSGGVLQKKLDGHRCMVTRDENQVTGYSRQGKPIEAIRKHILDSIAHRLPYDTTIDGELYAHGLPLQTISSLVKREQPDTSKITLVCYDLVSDEDYVDRHAELTSIIAGISKSVIVLPYTNFIDIPEMNHRFSVVREQGFEGLMVRMPGYGYESGVRSHSLIKIKHFEDAEFEVIDVEASSIGLGTCVCKNQNGQVFRVTAPGTHEFKLFCLQNKDLFIGRFLTVQFANLTNDGIPFQPVALQFKEEL
jgi:DNA ligase-1